MQDDRTGVFKNRLDFETTLTARNYFFAVATAYLDVLETPPLVAVSHDEEFPNRKLSAQMIEFKADVDNATSSALNRNPSLIEDWDRLIRGDKPANANTLIAKCARLYQSRHLIPHEYFRTIKKGRKRHAVALAGAA